VDDAGTRVALEVADLRLPPVVEQLATTLDFLVGTGYLP